MQVEQKWFSIDSACLFSGYLSGSQGCSLEGGFTVQSIQKFVPIFFRLNFNDFKKYLL